MHADHSTPDPKTTVPGGLPVLSAGRHNAPEDGACLMEYVSVLAGEPFTDFPRCVDPLLVHLAWMVNDSCPAALRNRLSLLAPSLVGTAGHDPIAGPTVVAACATFALEHSDARNGRLVRARRRAERRLDRAYDCGRDGMDGSRATMRDRIYRRLHAEEVLRESAYTVSMQDVERLPDLLSTATGALRRAISASARPQARSLLDQPSANSGEW